MVKQSHTLMLIKLFPNSMLGFIDNRRALNQIFEYPDIQESFLSKKGGQHTTVLRHQDELIEIV